MTPTTYNGLTRCDYETWEKCKLENPTADVGKATNANRCMWSDEEMSHCTNPTIQEMVLEKHKEDKIR